LSALRPQRNRRTHQPCDNKKAPGGAFFKFT
jgi:hypothetical protein